MRMPKEWTSPKSSTTTNKIESSSKPNVTARIDMSEEVAGKGLCPNCKEPMTPVVANGIHCVGCFACRIVLPKDNGNGSV